MEELAVRLAQNGHEVTVYGRKSYGLPGKSVYKGVRVLAMPSIATKNLDAITATFLGVLHILVHSYDVIHFHSIGPASLVWIIRLLKRKTLIVGTFHSPDYEHAKWGWFAKKYLRFGEWMICHIPHKTITISRSLQRYALKRYGLRTRYIPNGCNAEPLASSESLSSFGIKKNRYVLSVSRLVKHKGIHFLIEAFKYLEDTNKLPNNFKLVIVGSSANTDDYVRYLRFIAKGRKNIVFTGEQSGLPLRELFSHAYAFVQPSLSEGLSIALLEAMGYSLPVIVSDIPENREAIADRGFVFASGNADSLAEALAHILNNPKEAGRMGSLARERAESEYHWDAIADKTARMYRDEYGRIFSSKRIMESKTAVKELKRAELAKR